MYKIMRRSLSIFLFLLLAMQAVPGSAAPLNSEKLALKAKVVRHIEAHTEGGTYLFVDAEDTKLIKLKFLAMHPVVFAHPDGTYVLCADFENANGDKVLIDYYLRKIDQDYVVLSSLEGKRSILMRIGEKFGL
jgi:hypothetical protein